MLNRSNVELLTQWLRGVQVRAEVFARPDLCGAWRVNTGQADRAVFHLLNAGRAWLHRRGAEPVAMSAGDLAFVAPGQWHALTAEEAPPSTEHCLPESGTVEAQLVCGWLDVDDPGWSTLLGALPRATVLGAEQAHPELAGLGRLMGSLADQRDGGDGLLLERLAEVVLLLVLRQLLTESEHAQGLTAALADQRLARLLHAVHADPGQPWNLEEMASLAQMSRTAFAQHFRDTVGETPAIYVQRWRMQRARELLRSPGLSVALVAEACGYRTEAAFRRVFRRWVGQAPRSYRQTLSAAHGG